ncbi:MAG: M48 family metallopeptidase [Planctomycetes bacterium]|nr:M48 family metallopeptidase [Planctomycetota bacterium]
MNFYEHQDRARKRTKIIVFLFIVAVFMIMAMVVVPVGVVSEWNSGAIVVSAVFCLLIVGISALVKLGQLNDGGHVVAEMLGGTELQRTSSNSSERKVNNIVEEMAIASGMPVPPVYIIEDDSINAFAAGWTPSDAVIGVTRGCIEQLNRDELQGVIAHEFSHISHGDMRINIRLIGIIFGIMALGITGWIFVRHIGPMILYSSSRSRSKEGAGGAGIGLAIIVLGLFLVICGAIGTFFGRLIQAAVSRQREFLADASAVQYTRNPSGIGGALRQIGGIPDQSTLAKDAGQCNHMFFSQAVSSIFASHPPITERVARIEGIDMSSLQTPAHEQVVVGDARISGFSSTSVKTSVQEASAIEDKYIDRARQAIHNISNPIRSALGNSWSARLVMFSLLIDTQDVQQKNLLNDLLSNQERTELRKILLLIDKEKRSSRIPMIDLAAPALKQLSSEQQVVFVKTLTDIAQCDNVVSRFEWVLISVIKKHLGNNSFQKLSQGANKKLGPLSKDVVVVLSTLAYSGAENQAQAERAFNHAIHEIGLKKERIREVKDCTMESIHHALNKLQRLRFVEKEKLLFACESCVVHDDHITVAEAETIRAIGDVLDCPIPMFG